jgi:hypothetical protein
VSFRLDYFDSGYEKLGGSHKHPNRLFWIPKGSDFFTFDITSLKEIGLGIFWAV